MGYKAKNFAFTHLAGSLAADGLTFTVNTGTGSRFPTLGAGDFTFVVLESAEYRELVKVVEISGDTFTVAAGGRGYESTTPRAWVVGAVVRCCLTAGLTAQALAVGSRLDDHEAAADPHPQYATAAEVSAAVAPAQNTANGALQKSGGTMTGAITLAGDASSALHAVPKQQLDAAIAAVENGKQTIWVPAVAFVARNTNGATPGTVETATNKVMVKSLDFDAAVQEHAQISIRMPKSWDEGTVTAQFEWSHGSGSGNVVWGIQAVAISHDDPVDSAFGTGVVVLSTSTAVGDKMTSPETGAVTVAGTPQAGDLVVFQVYRQATDGNDTLAADARLHGVSIFYTVDTLSDA